MAIKILTDQERANLPGEFVKLLQGWVHYELAGSENGPVVVMVHGFATPLFVWDPLVPALKEAGFRKPEPIFAWQNSNFSEQFL